MFNQMRSVLALQRAIAMRDGREPVSAYEVLQWATLEGARANGLDHKVGSLTPGKEAAATLAFARPSRAGTGGGRLPGLNQASSTLVVSMS